MLKKHFVPISISYLIGCLFEIFFVLGFLDFTGKTNIYVLYSLILLLLLFRCRMEKLLDIFLLIVFFILLSFSFYQGGHEAFRVYKTLAVILPLFFFIYLRKEKYSLSLFFHGFILINVLLVYIDYILFFAIGRTIIHFASFGFYPRPCGLILDSNFYSYLIICYLFYLKEYTGKWNKFISFSLFLSGSLSGILIFICLFFYEKYRKNPVIGSSSYRKMKYQIIGLSFLAFGVYMCLVAYSSKLLNWLRSFELNALLELKIISLSHRFEVQSETFSYFFSHGNIWLGIGAGKARELTDIGLNLHNSYLQIFLEMGLPLIIWVLICIYYCMVRIYNLKYLILFCLMFLLGNILEVYYFPLLGFIFFISFSSPYKHDKATI